ncbi:M23 family metallopeptidase [Leucobacter sp. HY1910]
MSAPALVGCVAAALCLGLPVLAAGSHLVSAQRVTGAADAAALAAADAITGWLDSEACDAAAEVARSAGATVERCDLVPQHGEARIELSINTPIGAVTARARAGGVVMDQGPAYGAGAWAWPAASGGVAQGFHDGFSIDLAAPVGTQLLAPYDGVVIAMGPDGGGMPQVCRENPGWWRGTNETIIMRHDYEGRTIFSSHNHIAAGSVRGLGLTVGARVAAGQPVAAAGMSGCTSGPHTHFTLSTRPENSFPDLNPFVFIGPP